CKNPTHPDSQFPVHPQKYKLNPAIEQAAAQKLLPDFHNEEPSITLLQKNGQAFHSTADFQAFRQRAALENHAWRTSSESRRRLCIAWRSGVAAEKITVNVLPTPGVLSTVS